MFWMAMILLAGYLLRRYIDYKRELAHSRANARPGYRGTRIGTRGGSQAVDMDADEIT